MRASDSASPEGSHTMAAKARARMASSSARNTSARRGIRISTKSPQPTPCRPRPGAWGTPDSSSANSSAIHKIGPPASTPNRLAAMSAKPAAAGASPMAAGAISKNAERRRTRACARMDSSSSPLFSMALPPASMRATASRKKPVRSDLPPGDIGFLHRYVLYMFLISTLPAQKSQGRATLDSPITHTLYIPECCPKATDFRWETCQKCSSCLV